jgi:integrase
MIINRDQRHSQNNPIILLYNGNRCRKNKEALSKKDVIAILNNCSDIRLKTYVMLLAATGMRAAEALNIRIKDIDFDNNPATLYIKGENTKTKTDRLIFLTDEVTNQINAWLKYTHRTRSICYQDKDDRRNRKTHRI